MAEASRPSPTVPTPAAQPAQTISPTPQYAAGPMYGQQPMYIGAQGYQMAPMMQQVIPEDSWRVAYHVSCKTVEAI